MNTISTDGDEYCRITIDSLTKSYKIGSPVRPKAYQGRQTRSASHSLLINPTTEGRNLILERKKNEILTCFSYR